MKIEISEGQRSYQIEITKEKEAQIYGLKIGENFDGGIVGAIGYELKITGGSDKDGFPMRVDLVGSGKRRILLRGTPGFHPERKGVTSRKMVRGNIVSDAISQLNVVVTKKGEKKLSEIFGKEEKKETKEKKTEKIEKKEVEKEKSKES